MKAQLLLPGVLLLCLGFAPAMGPSAGVTTQVTGDYVEARTASVFAGACHFNGEVVTTGNDAIMARNFTGGTWKATDLTGVRAMAAVSCAANLRDDAASRKSELVIDPSASSRISRGSGRSFKEQTRTTSASLHRCGARACSLYERDGHTR